TIKKYLGNNYEVIASYGHVRDLPNKDGSVLPDEDFTMTWETDSHSEKRIRDIANLVKGAENLYLATDPDREGEAISWHVLNVLQEKKKLKNVNVHRVVFNEITKTAVLEAVNNPRILNQQMIDAYLARRALDYLVGFNISPVLWRKLPGCKSAGRVQSVALRLICERENEIELFDSSEYWTIDANLASESAKIFKSRLYQLDGKKLAKFTLTNEQDALIAKTKIENSAFSIEKIERRKVKRHPAPPFTTSTMQQEAARKLHFSANRTMRLAQSLYEGVDIGGETTGLITYMRTDSVKMANEAVVSIRNTIEKDYGDKYLPESPRYYKTKAKFVQEGHEAVRPTDISRHPKHMAKYLDKDSLRLYELVWKRAVSSQMESAEFDKVTIDSASAERIKENAAIILRASGSIMTFDGFLTLYHESKDESDKDEDKESLLPPVKEGEKVTTKEVKPEQHFTQPPFRFTESSLVKKLEELGIGRPSTYAAILTKLQNRSYARIEKRHFVPESIGRILIVFLESYFGDYVQYNFTADMEDKLDNISEGNLEWKKLLSDFWVDFSKTVEKVTPLTRTEVIDEINDKFGSFVFKEKEDGSDPRLCPACKKGQLNIKLGKFGAFIGCSNHPECKYTRPLALDGENGNESEEPKALGKDTETNLEVSLRKGPYGYYIQLGETTPTETTPKESGAKKTTKKKKVAKPKRASLPKNLSPSDITFETALQLLALPRDIAEHPETGKMVTAGIGRYGPYVKHETKYKSLTDDDNVLNV
ncbi:MAG: type I DNA topoisomerase, partial [Alphaproteobacteria bacterium]|nr:type I DNA topoisomerase [Alphaproteobacteria bacterium]